MLLQVSKPPKMRSYIRKGPFISKRNMRTKYKYKKDFTKRKVVPSGTKKKKSQREKKGQV